MSYKSDLTSLLSSSTASVGIVGLGYVGLPLSLAFLSSGFKVIGFDIDNNKVSALSNGISYIKHVESSAISCFVDKNLFVPTSDFSTIADVDAIIICVPTPLNKFREPDLSYIHSTLSSISPYLRKGQILSLESTTYPGTTDEILLPLIASLGFSVGNDFFLVYSPEREDPGNPKFSTSSIPKVLGGITPDCSEVGIQLYCKTIQSVVPVSSARTAEFTKLLENIHRAVNIGLMNELKPLAAAMNIDLYEVIRAASTKPFGFVPYYPGPGLGGHCIPIDPFYLTWKAREFGMHTRFIELAGEINTSMPKYVLDVCSFALNTQSKPLKHSKVLILGLSYKKNVDDMRESPSVELVRLFEASGSLVSYSDPYFPVFPSTRQYSSNLASTPLTPDTLSSFDLVILATDHDCFDYTLIQSHSHLLVDTRGRYEPSSSIFRA